MARFVYRLEPIRRVKKQLEDQAKDKLGREMAELSRRIEKLERDAAEADEAMNAFRRDASGSFTVADIRSRNDHIMLSRRRVSQSLEKRQEAELAADEARSELVKAAQQRKMFDKLHDRARDAHIERERRKEQMIADETVSYKLGVALAESGAGGEIGGGAGVEGAFGAEGGIGSRS